MVVAAVAFLPLGIAESGTRLIDPTTVALGGAVAVMSSVLPYTSNCSRCAACPPRPSPS